MRDIVIVGGGPAGAAAGIFLSNKGLDCIIVDRAEFPREKACGGAITARAVEEFPFLEKFRCTTTIQSNIKRTIFRML